MASRGPQPLPLPAGYRIAGLAVRSDFVIPGAIPERGNGLVDVAIRLCADTGAADNPCWCDPLIIAAPQDFTFRPLPGLAFRIRDGGEIALARPPGIADSDVQTFLLGSAWGVLSHQRGLLPLHCSAVGLDGRAFAFTGPSGAGKSTLAAGLSVHGFAHVCDDVCILDPADADMAVQPMPKALKLRRDAAAALGLPCGSVISTLVEKYTVAPPRVAFCAPLRLAALYVLQESGSDAPAITELRGGAAQFRALHGAIYRREWLSLLREQGALFSDLAALARRIRLFRFSRPRDFRRFAEGAALLGEHITAIAAED